MRKIRFVRISWINLTLARISSIGKYISRPKKAKNASVTIDAFGIFLAFFANATAFHISVDVHGKSLLVDFCIVMTLVGVSITVAFFTLEGIGFGVRPPWFLNVAFSTLVAIGTGGAMLA